MRSSRSVGVKVSIEISRVDKASAAGHMVSAIDGAVVGVVVDVSCIPCVSVVACVAHCYSNNITFR